MSKQNQKANRAQTLKYLNEEEKLLTKMAIKLEEQLNRLKVEEMHLINSLSNSNNDRFTEQLKKFTGIGRKVRENVEAASALQLAITDSEANLSDPLELDVSRSLLRLASGQKESEEEEDD